MPEARFPTTWSDQTAVTIAAGEIDLANAGWLRTALVSAIDAGATGLVVDMTAATFLDSAGVAALVRAARRASATGSALRLAVTAPPVLRVLDLVGLDQLVPVYPSVAQAVASLPDQEG